MNRLKLLVILLTSILLLSGCPLRKSPDDYLGTWAKQGDSIKIYKETVKDATNYYLKDRQSVLPLRLKHKTLYYKDVELQLSGDDLILLNQHYKKVQSSN